MTLVLELARGLAALWVFLFHVGIIFETSSPIIYRLSQYGILGVPMFFVISGYVITCSAESNLKNEKSPFIFLKSRFLRIYPAFWASIIVVLVIPYIMEAISALKSGVYTAPANLIQKLNYSEWFGVITLSKVFWATSNDLQAEFNKINSVYWTLAIEFQFYLVVFISLFFRNHYRKIIAAISIVAIFVTTIPNQLNHGLFIHYWPPFSIGIVLSYLHQNKIVPSSVIKSRIAILATLCITITTPILVSTINQSSILFSVCFGAFIWAISDIEKILNRIKNSRNTLLVWLLEPWLILGGMSYSVYLLHGKIYQIPNMFVRQLISQDSILFGTLTIIGTLLLCYLFFFCVERHFLSKNYKAIQQNLLTKTAGVSS